MGQKYRSFNHFPFSLSEEPIKLEKLQIVIQVLLGCDLESHHTETER